MVYQHPILQINGFQRQRLTAYLVHAMMGYGVISNGPHLRIVTFGFFVDDLTHYVGGIEENILSISQLC
jgi:hypothetical protein